MKIKEIWQSLISSYTFNIFAWCAYADLLNIWIIIFPLGILFEPMYAIFYIFIYWIYFTIRTLLFLIIFILEKKYLKQKITDPFILKHKGYSFFIILGILLHICGIIIAYNEFFGD